MLPTLRTVTKSRKSWAENVARMGETKYTYILVGIPERKGPLFKIVGHLFLNTCTSSSLVVRQRHDASLLRL